MDGHGVKVETVYPQVALIGQLTCDASNSLMYFSLAKNKIKRKTMKFNKKRGCIPVSGGHCKFCGNSWTLYSSMRLHCVPHSLSLRESWLENGIHCYRKYSDIFSNKGKS